ncbi:MAG: hypothetical protein ABI587_16805 [Gemmatimonadales bacterium]
MKFAILIPLSLAISVARPAHMTSGHEAQVLGAVHTTLAGQASFGPVRQAPAGAASFSLELGTYSEQGSVIFSRIGGERPTIGVYDVTPMSGGAEGRDEFHAFVSLGSPEHPVGAFRAVSGRVTITQSSDDRILGRYEIHAVGFVAADLDTEDRTITVQGGFSAEAATPASSYEASIAGVVSQRAGGAAEFGAVGMGDERSFSLTLGAYSEQGAVVLSRGGPIQPEPGSYRVSVTGDEFHGLVVTGSPSHPTGVFHVVNGTITITSSTPERIAGTFALHAVGFMAVDPDRDAQEITVSGSFLATAGGTTVTLSQR